MPAQVGQAQRLLNDLRTGVAELGACAMERLLAAEVTVVADPRSARAHELRDLLARNGVPYAFHANDSPEVIEEQRARRAEAMERIKTWHA